MFVDTYAPGWLEELATRPAAPDGSASYLLIDGVFVPGLHRDFQRLLGADAVRLLFEGRAGYTDEVGDVSPFLLRYPEGEPRLAAVLERCSGWPMLSVLESREALPDLARRLAAWCLVDNDGQMFNFRFTDTRRLPGIVAALDDQQRRSLAGPATTWRYIGRDGVWHALDLPGVAAPYKDGPQPLTSRQFAQMLADSEIDEAVRGLSSVNTALPATPFARYRLVATAMEIAKQHGIAEEDRRAWCAYFVRAGAPQDERAIAGLMHGWRELA